MANVERMFPKKYIDDVLLDYPEYEARADRLNREVLRSARVHFGMTK